MTVATFLSEHETVALPIEGYAVSEKICDGVIALLNDPAHHRLIAEPGSCIKRIGDMALDAVPLLAEVNR